MGFNRQTQLNEEASRLRRIPPEQHVLAWRDSVKGQLRHGISRSPSMGGCGHLPWDMPVSQCHPLLLGGLLGQQGCGGQLGL